ncbi:MAG: WbqC family protein, partial [Dehalococcoidia bacterium]
MKIVTMHQPNYLPWIGLFSKITHSDCFIIVGDVQYVTNSVINRNKIRTKDGWIFLTIPVGRKVNGLNIYDVPLPRDKKWMENHWKAIKQNYVKADFFGHYQAFFEGLYQKDFEYLWQINEEIILYLLRCFEIDVEVVRASDLNVDPDLHGTDLLIALLRSVNASVYLSGPSGRNYLDFQKFSQNN